MQTGSKRKRASTACVSCHNRRVRCSIDLHGVPCSNCLRDGTSCQVYERKLNASSTRRLIRPRQPAHGPAAAERAYPPTPSTTSIHVTEISVESLNSFQDAPFSDRPLSRHNLRIAGSSGRVHTESHAVQESPPEIRAGSPRQPEQACGSLMAYYAGEAQGLDFVLDICYPTRIPKGSHYIINRNRHRPAHIKEHFSAGPEPMPPKHVRQELLRAYFYYVHPFLPVLDAGQFLINAEDGNENSSRLLLWSIFFAAASFTSSELLKRAGFSSRKSLREYFYQRAKEIYDAQLETEKITLIQSALLLAFWYVDLVDQDGSWYWTGVAISLSHTIGLHRAAPFDDMCFPLVSTSKLSVWRRIWWSLYYREAWAALAYGRPMRICLDDCDVPVSTVDEVLDDLTSLPMDVRDTYLPNDLEYLAGLWLNLLQLSMKLESILALHYRPRRPTLSMTRLEHDHNEVRKLQEIPCYTDLESPPTLIYSSCLQCYCNSVVIVLYRSYVNNPPEYLSPNQKDQLRSLALDRVKSAASGTTSILTRLVSSALIKSAPAMLLTAMVLAMQIHLHEYHHSEGLAQQYAYHHLNLHMLVLSDLRKTHWLADQHYNLFQEALKTMEASKVQRNMDNSTECQRPKSWSSLRPGVRPDPEGRYENVQNSVLDSRTFQTGGNLDKYTAYLNPFIDLPPDFTPVDWGINIQAPFNVEATEW